MKRLLCFLALLACLSVCAFAVPKTDGQFGPREYDCSMALVQPPQNESNNHVQTAFLYWAASPADHSVYLAVAYHCSDHAMEEGRTGIKVFINGELIGTVFTDGVEGVDHDKHELVAFLDDGASRQPYDSFCEMRVGLKFWPQGEIVAGVQILDFSGNPSNYYQQLVYSPYTTPTKPTESPKTTAEKTTDKTTTSAATTVTTAETTRSAPRTTIPPITASPKRETTATAVAVPEPKTTALKTETVSVSETTKEAKTKKPKTTKAAATKRAETTASEAETTDAAAAAVLPATTETAPSTTSGVLTSAQVYSEMNKVKIVGTVLVVVILTAALMSAVFLGMRQKGSPEARNTHEQYDDFG